MTLLERAKAGELLTPEELAELLKKPIKWIYEKRRPRCINPIPAFPMGRGSLRFQWSAIIQWLDSCRIRDAETLTAKRTSLHPLRKGHKQKSTTRQKEAVELSKFAQEFFKNVEMIDGVLASNDDHE